MKKNFLKSAAIVAAMTVGMVNANAAGDLATGKIGYLIPTATTAEVSNPNEQAPLAYFEATCTAGSVITSNDVAKINTAEFDVIWVHVDQMNLAHGYANLPFSNETVAALKQFVADGGCIFLSKHATQLIVPLGRIEDKFAPGIFGSGDGGNNTDVWTVNAQIGYDFITLDPTQYYDHRGHAIYAGIEEGLYNDFGHETFPLEGTGDGTEMWREDHNCKWDFNAYKEVYTAEGANTVEKFQNENNCVVLGAWGHVKDHACAGIIEFKPTATIKGTILANGLAAYEWAPRSGVNAYHANIEKLTANTLTYLLNNSATSVIGTSVANDVVIIANNNNIRVAGIDGNATVSVYAIDGSLVAEQNVNNAATLTVGMKGVAIVKVTSAAGTVAKKVIVK